MAGDVTIAAQPRGSEWRKWDLHVHVPGTKLNNGYKEGDKARMFSVLEDSDVEVFGLTDYFSLDSVFDFVDGYREQFPDSRKVFLPNLELRLNEIVNDRNEVVDLHLLFRPEVARDKVAELLLSLKTVCTDKSGRAKKCSELTSAADFSAACVTRDALAGAIADTFGLGERSDNLIVVAAANNNGLRAARGSARKAVICDEIDKFSDAFFGSASNRDYFLTADRYEDPEVVARQKPVYAGSDAHNLRDLEAWLGQQVRDASNDKNILWIKADPTFEGLLQTLAEPAERAAIKPVAPDRKRSYHVISRVAFPEGADFPRSIDLNPNLCAIIGSRSSGKSAFLAHVAHAVDSSYTVAQQVAAGVVGDQAQAGPAAGFTWEQVAGSCASVEWADPAVESGKVIYIPQNSLYKISERPQEITERIRLAVGSAFPDLEAAIATTERELETQNIAVRESVRNWFAARAEGARRRHELASLGARPAVEGERVRLLATIESASAKASDGASLGLYRGATDSLARLADYGGALEGEASRLKDLEDSRAGDSAIVEVEIRTVPDVTGLSSVLTSIFHRVAVVEIAGSPGAVGR